jgi:ABC-type multidrug transport system fused ATPase/permease subunit
MTLVKLLARLYDSGEGRILLGGYDLRDSTRAPRDR